MSAAVNGSAALDLSITTPEGMVYKGEATKVVAPALDGELGILPRHAPLIGLLGAGELRVHPTSSPGPLRFFLEGGFLQILKNRVLVLATKALPHTAIDPARVEEELRKLLSEKVPPRASLETLAARAEKIRALKAKLKVAMGRSGHP